MSMFTVIGIAADALGLGVTRTYGLDERGAAWRHDEYWKVPSSAYRVAKDHLSIDWRHNKVIGKVAHLERQHGNLWAIGEVDIERLDGITDFAAVPIWWSPESWDTRSRHSVDAELLAVALTPQPGSSALPPVSVLAGDLERAARHAPRRHTDRLNRAVDARRHRRYGDHLRIHDLDPTPAPHPTVHTRHADLRPVAPRSESGQRRLIDGQWLEVEHWPAVGAKVLSVR